MPQSVGSQRNGHDRVTELKALYCVDHNKLWKILKKMGIPDHLTRLRRNLYAGRETTDMERHGFEVQLNVLNRQDLLGRI